MPSVPDEFVPIRMNNPSPVAAPREEPGYLETLGAAGVQANWPYRAYRYLANRAEVTADPDYNPFETIKGTKYESDPQRFAFARSDTETRAIMQEWDEDEQALDTLSRAGWSGTVAGIGMGMLDPTIFLPVAKVFSGVAQGASALRLGADTALSGAAAGAIGEAAMMATKPDYTVGDAAAGIATTTVLSGLLGAGAGALLSRAERQTMASTLDADRQTWGSEIAPRQPQSAGAAAADTRELTMRSVPGLNKLPDLTAKVSPPRRVLNSPFMAARRATVDLVETPYIFEENTRGIATMQGPALNRAVMLETARARVGAEKMFEDVYGRYRFGNAEAGRIERSLANVNDVLGRSTDGKMSFDQFKRAVDDAMRSGDSHPVPEVAEAAKFLRERVSYWRDRAIAAKLLPEDIDVKTADSYMMRSWNKRTLIARRPEAKRIFADWIAGEEARALSEGAEINPRSAQELDDLADEIIDRIVGSPDGRLPYDAPKATERAGKRTGQRGPLAGRVFLIPDKLVRDFIETDVARTYENYLRTMVPDVLLTERFGDVDMTETFRRINEEAAQLQAAAKTEKERLAINAQRDAVITDLAAMRDRIRNTYGYSSDPRQRMMGRVAAFAQRYDMVTNLGGAALSSLSDLAGVQWRYGLATTFKHAWRPMLKALTDKQTREALRANRAQLQTLGIAAETYLATRSAGIYDVIDVYGHTTRGERAMGKIADKFGVASLLTPWTDFGQFAAGMVSGAETVKAAAAVAAGKGSKRQIRNLAEAGIDGAMAQRIARQIETLEGADVVSGIRFPNTALWTDAGAREAFEGAIARDVDLMILKPGAERPLMMSKPIAALILQYKSFVVAANERLLVRSLQARDHQVLQGLASAIVLGMLAEYAYIYAADRDPKDQPKTPADWVKAGLSRSGAFGWYQEGNAIASKWTGGAVDAYRAIGAGQIDPRYISRSKLGAILGPTYGKVESAVKASSKISALLAGEDVNWSAADTAQMRRMLIGQNLFYIRRYLLDPAEEQVNEWLGVEPKD